MRKELIAVREVRPQNAASNGVRLALETSVYPWEDAERGRDTVSREQRTRLRRRQKLCPLLGAAVRRQRETFFSGMPFCAVGNVYHDCVLLLPLKEINCYF